MVTVSICGLINRNCLQHRGLQRSNFNLGIWETSNWSTHLIGTRKLKSVMYPVSYTVDNIQEPPIVRRTVHKIIDWCWLVVLERIRCEYLTQIISVMSNYAYTICVEKWIQWTGHITIIDLHCQEEMDI